MEWKRKKRARRPETGSDPKSNVGSGRRQKECDGSSTALLALRFQGRKVGGRSHCHCQNFKAGGRTAAAPDSSLPSSLLPFARRANGGALNFHKFSDNDLLIPPIGQLIAVLAIGGQATRQQRQAYHSLIGWSALQRPTAFDDFWDSFFCFDFGRWLGWTLETNNDNGHVLCLVRSHIPSALPHRLPFPIPSCSCTQSIKHSPSATCTCRIATRVGPDAGGGRSRLTSHFIPIVRIGRVAIACSAYVIRPLGG